MAVEMLKQVGEAEAKADLIRKQANDAAKAAVDEAATKAKEIVAASEQRVRTETAQVLKEAQDRRLRYGRATYLLLDECHRWSKAQAQAEEQTKAYLQDIEKQCEQIRSDARVNLTKAADIIVAKVVSVSG